MLKKKGKKCSREWLVNWDLELIFMSIKEKKKGNSLSSINSSHSVIFQINFTRLERQNISRLQLQKQDMEKAVNITDFKKFFQL